MRSNSRFLSNGDMNFSDTALLQKARLRTGQALVLFLTLVFCCQPCLADSSALRSEQARALLKSVLKAVGGVEKLRSLKDVEYTYTYRDPSSGLEDVSLERYIFDGEMSWGKYLKREIVVTPELQGTLIQGFDGKRTWVTADGKLIKDEKILKQADFLRKTNYYWFTMMFKLFDPGVNYEYEGTRTVSGTTYDRVRLTFQPGVGDVSDTYLLYINPRTKLVDKFLFTVMDFDITQPYLMEVRYEEIEGLKLPTYRRYTPGRWDGIIKEEKWIEEISENIRFNIGLNPRDFSPPSEDS